MTTSLTTQAPKADSLVLYKGHAARVLAVGEKIDIELAGGQGKRVRPKDIEVLHPGPVRSLGELDGAPDGDLDTAWELLEGGETSLPELAELMFDDFTPQSAWATWQTVADGLHFSGGPSAIQVRTRAQVEEDRARREAKAQAEQDWKAFLARLQAARPLPEDRERLGEVERLALGKSEHSRILAALGHQETPQHAHRAMIQLGLWGPDHNPHPARNALPSDDPDLPVPELPQEERLDLTHLRAYAIDDEDNQDPDDALSLDGDRLWVHVADVAALVVPDGELDREARSRGSNQYLPERTVNMLPALVTERLGLGLEPISPALSFALRRTDDGEIAEVEVHRTWVRVERLSYGEVDRRLDEDAFAELVRFIEPFRARRHAQDAANIELPEVSVRLRDGEVEIRPLPRLHSRALVADAMVMAGEAVARFCQERAIPIPYVTQPSPDKVERPVDLAGMYAYRRRFKPSRVVSEPGPHFGLGLPIYTRATSPLRRYSDLLVHQQLRAWLDGRTPLGVEQVVERSGEAEASGAAVRRSERLSNQHWKLVYLRRHPHWSGEAVVVDKEEHKAVLIVPELALETKVRLRGEVGLNERLRVAPREVDLQDLGCSFRVLQHEGGE